MSSLSSSVVPSSSSSAPGRPTTKFVWGAAISAHQVEGNNIHNDWWQWERRAQNRPQSGRAVEHYQRFADDIALAKSLSHTALRLSLEWSRIEPAPNQWNKQAIAHYREVLTALRHHGLTSFVTLHHFTNPQWLADEGGWLDQATPHRFARYVQYVVEELGDLVDVWLTINEPMVYATNSYWQAKWPPQQRNLRHLLRVIRHLASGHQQAYHVIHDAYPQATVGLAKNVIAYLPANPHRTADRLAARLSSWWFNHRFFALTGRTHDFIGVNFYFTQEQQGSLVPPKIHAGPWHGPVSDQGWPIRPAGLTHALLEMKRYQLPLYVTENGLADASDHQRSEFIRQHLRALEAAQRQGVDVRGYFHWSLLDNFEWADGFTPRFGLVAVNSDTMERTPRPSAYVYQAIIKQAQRTL